MILRSYGQNGGDVCQVKTYYWVRFDEVIAALSTVLCAYKFIFRSFSSNPENFKMFARCKEYKYEETNCSGESFSVVSYSVIASKAQFVKAVSPGLSEMDVDYILKNSTFKNSIKRPGL